MKRKKNGMMPFFSSLSLLTPYLQLLLYSVATPNVFLPGRILPVEQTSLVLCEQHNHFTLTHKNTHTHTHTRTLSTDLFNCRRITLDSYFYSQFNCSIRCKDTRIHWKKKKSILSSSKKKKREIFAVKNSSLHLQTSDLDLILYQ